MEGIVVFLMIFCSFLNGYWILVCFIDSDCFDFECCCKVGYLEEKSLCINCGNCYGFCFECGDCFVFERCDIFKNFCIIVCIIIIQCYEGYICYSWDCIWDDLVEFELNIIILIVVIVGFGVFLFLVCCCMKYKCCLVEQCNGILGNCLINRVSGGLILW